MSLILVSRCWGADGEKRLGYGERGQEAGVDYYEHLKKKEEKRAGILIQIKKY